MVYYIKYLNIEYYMIYIDIACYDVSCWAYFNIISLVFMSRFGIWTIGLYN